jgi:hypothetical protein
MGAYLWQPQPGDSPLVCRLLPGTLELVVLQLLKAEPTNGYDLSLRIQAESGAAEPIDSGQQESDTDTLQNSPRPSHGPAERTS